MLCIYSYMHMYLCTSRDSMHAHTDVQYMYEQTETIDGKLVTQGRMEDFQPDG